MSKKNKVLKVFKFIGAAIISFGVAAIVKNIIKGSTPVDTGALQKFCIKVGGYFVGGVVSVAATKQFEEKVDKGVELLDKALDEISEEVDKEVQIVNNELVKEVVEGT